MPYFEERLTMQINELINSYSDFIKKKFGRKVYKAGLSTGLICPHRVNNSGCIYCNPSTFVGENQASESDVLQQFRKSAERIRDMFGDVGLLAYFQDETSLAGSPELLINTFKEILELDECLGLIISTRPDYIPESVLEFLSRQEKFVSVEFGLQSIHDKSLSFLNRGHSFADFEKALKITSKYIRHIGVHLILGIPGETEQNIMNTIDYVSESKVISEVKFHNMVAYEGTRLSGIYEDVKDQIPDYEEYIVMLSKVIERLNPDIVISRLFTSHVADSAKVLNPFPGHKTQWIEKLRKHLLAEGIKQGKDFQL